MRRLIDVIAVPRATFPGVAPLLSAPSLEVGVIVNTIRKGLDCDV